MKVVIFGEPEDGYAYSGGVLEGGVKTPFNLRVGDRFPRDLLGEHIHSLVNGIQYEVLSGDGGRVVFRADENDLILGFY